MHITLTKKTRSVLTEFKPIIPLTFLFLLGSVGVFAILPTFALRFLFILVVAAFVTWILKKREKVDTNILVLGTVYVLTVAQFGLHFYFRLPAWLMVFLGFIWMWLVLYYGFKLLSSRFGLTAKLLSLAGALASAQIAMALIFWPTHFLVSATIFFLLFYLAWMILYFYIEGLLNWQRILVHVFFYAVFTVLFIMFAQWTI